MLSLYLKFWYHLHVERGRNDMTLVEIILFILGTVGAIILGRKRKFVLMALCIVVAASALFLLAATGILLMGID